MNKSKLARFNSGQMIVKKKKREKEKERLLLKGYELDDVDCWLCSCTCADGMVSYRPGGISRACNTIMHVLKIDLWLHRFVYCYSVEPSRQYKPHPVRSSHRFSHASLVFIIIWNQIMYLEPDDTLGKFTILIHFILVYHSKNI